MMKDIAPAGIRFPAELKEALQKAAHKNKRSMNAEVVARIAASFENKIDLKELTDGEFLDEFVRRFGAGSVRTTSVVKGPIGEDRIIERAWPGKS
jgi:hypothetical protein